MMLILFCQLEKRVLRHLAWYEEQEVPPLHLACTAVSMLDTFPARADTNFSRQFGLESEYVGQLQRYLEGENKEGECVCCVLSSFLTGNCWPGRKLPLNFPIFLTVTPKPNGTVERAVCVWLSSFSPLIPPEMDRHLGFLEIPQPAQPNIEVSSSTSLTALPDPISSAVQIYASGRTVKYARTFAGFANDWIYRQEVKKLMDSIIVSSTKGYVNGCCKTNPDQMPIP